MKSVFLWTGVCLAAALTAAGCSSKTETSGSQGAASQSGSPAGSGAAATGAGATGGKPGSSAVAARCSLPEPTGKKLAAPDPSYAAMFNDVATKCEADGTGRCDPTDDLIDKAAKSVSESNEAPAAVVAACAAGLDHESKRARGAAAKCLMELAPSIKDTAAVLKVLLDKVEAAKDSGERLSYAAAVEKLNAAGAGYTCRVLRLIDSLPKDEAATGDLIGSLHGFGGETNNEGFDFAYELIMSKQSGVTVARALELITVYAPKARKGEVCEKLTAIIKGGMEGWGHASSDVWKDESCKQRDAIVANAVAKLKWLETPTNFKEIDRPLLDANFIEDMPKWPGITDAQKKSVCDAAKSLETSGKADDAKSMGKKISANCK